MISRRASLATPQTSMTSVTIMVVILNSLLDVLNKKMRVLTAPELPEAAAHW
jgi:hypothetical protein